MSLAGITTRVGEAFSSLSATREGLRARWAVTVMITKLPNDNGGVIFLYGPPYPRIQLSARHPAGL